MIIVWLQPRKKHCVPTELDVSISACVPNGLVTTISTSAEINSTLKAIKM